MQKKTKRTNGKVGKVSTEKTKQLTRSPIDANNLLIQKIEAPKRNVKCPYCAASKDRIEVGLTTVTLLYPLPQLPPTYDPNTYSTKYSCKNCGKHFWIDRKVKLIEKLRL